MGGTVENSTHRSSTTSNTSSSLVWRRIFGQAVRTSTTDIHIEPQLSALVVRFRRQGALSTDLTLSADTIGPLTRLLKELARLDLRQTRSPQEGSFSQVHNHHTYYLGIDVMPLLSDERIVIHIHDPAAQPPDLAALGLWGSGLAHFQNALVSPHGLIIVSGPNHSGLSTTLASCAAALSNPFNQVASIEEKILYRIPGVSYMTVKPSNGMTWPRVLRMQLKHQPKVIVLGNIPDRETAEAVIDSAHHQRLILGGIRSDSALTAVVQLLRLSGNPLDLATSLKLISSQRLVPRLCQSCRETYVPSADVQKKLAQMFGLDHAALGRLQQLRQDFLAQGLDNESLGGVVSVNQSGIIRLWRAKNGGCHQCRKSGFKGAMALFEVIPANDTLRSSLAKAPTASVLGKDIDRARVTSWRADGLIKALCGLISIEAVLKG